jgi:probable HAF family extracellular repeat protein
MKFRTSTLIAVTIVATALAVPAGLGAQDNPAQAKKLTQHHHYQLIVLGTLGGPQSYGDAGHGAANINSSGTAAGDADTDVPDPFYPNYNPLLTGGLIGSYPFVFHAFTSSGGGLTDLGSLPGANSSTPSHITDNGLVAGQSLNGAIDPLTGWPQMNAVFWKDRQIINLGTLGGYESQSFDVNNRGQVIGGATNNIPDTFLAFGTQLRAFLWDNSKGMQDLGTLGGPDAAAIGINERGQIAGNSFTSFIPNPNTMIPTEDPFLWEKGEMIDLGSLGGTIGSVGGLNNRGQIIGNSNLPGDVNFHGFLWDHGTLTDVGTLGGTFSSANALNEEGHIAGLSTIAGDQIGHAFLWKAGVMTDLGTLPGFPDSSCTGAFGINSRDQVVGQGGLCGDPEPHAFLWENGDMVDVNSLVPPGTNLTLVEIEQINDSGEMFGIGTLPDGNNRAFLLIPCGEDHPGIEGCDYGLVDGKTATTGISTSRGIQTSAPSGQDAPMFRSPANPMLRRFGHGQWLLYPSLRLRSPLLAVPMPRI